MMLSDVSDKRKRECIVDGEIRAHSEGFNLTVFLSEASGGDPPGSDGSLTDGCSCNSDSILEPNISVGSIRALHKHAAMRKLTQ